MEALANRYGGSRKLAIVDGTHSSPRNGAARQFVARYLKKHVRLPEDAAVADGAPAARCFVCRAAFVAAATRFFDECGVDVTRDAVARFADAAFRVHDHLAVDDVLAAAASLEGPRATASLATAVAAGR